MTKQLFWFKRNLRCRDQESLMFADSNLGRCPPTYSSNAA